MIVLQEPSTRNDSPSDDQQHRPVAPSREGDESAEDQESGSNRLQRPSPSRQRTWPTEDERNPPAIVRAYEYFSRPHASYRARERKY